MKGRRGGCVVIDGGGIGSLCVSVVVAGEGRGLEALLHFPSFSGGLFLEQPSLLHSPPFHATLVEKLSEGKEEKGAIGISTCMRSICNVAYRNCEHGFEGSRNQEVKVMTTSRRMGWEREREGGRRD